MTTRPPLLVQEGEPEGGIGSNIKGWVQGLTSNIGMPKVADLTEEKGEYQSPNYEFETSLSCRFCPMVIEVMDTSLLNSNSSLMFLLPYEHESVGKGKWGQIFRYQGISRSYLPRLRPYDEVMRAFSAKPIPKLYKNKHMATKEKKRRQVVLSYQAAWEAAVHGGSKVSKATAVRATA